MTDKPTLYHIPVCPFSQRVEILLDLKGARDAVRFSVVDITKPRDPALLVKSRGVTALPILELTDGTVLLESLVLLRYFEDLLDARPVFATSPYARAVENMLVAHEGPFVNAGYGFVLNQDPAARAGFEARMLEQYAKLDAFLVHHAPDTDFLFERFGFAEAVFTPMFMRFWFLAYYEGFALPDEGTYARVRRYRDACLAHPSAQQVTHDEIVKLYYDYAQGAGNGKLLPGRTRSSFTLDPDHRARPMPPREKYGLGASDEALGLV